LVDPPRLAGSPGCIPACCYAVSVRLSRPLSSSIRHSLRIIYKSFLGTEQRHQPNFSTNTSIFHPSSKSFAAAFLTSRTSPSGPDTTTQILSSFPFRRPLSTQHLSSSATSGRPSDRPFWESRVEYLAVVKDATLMVLSGQILPTSVSASQ
jgi:hypothetical protein